MRGWGAVAGALLLFSVPCWAAERPLAVNAAVVVLQVLAGMVAALVAIYAVRHYLLASNRLFFRQAHSYAAVTVADWPRVTVLVPAHNEEAVIADCLRALLKADYPAGRLLIVPVNDRSSDGTRAIIDAFAARHPAAIRPYHRQGGLPGKAAALKEVCALLDTDCFLVFDADYLPSPGLIKKLMAPFCDPEVGCVMGRVVPINRAANLLTRLLDLERVAGYQINQQGRMNLDLLPQYGGTVGGARLAAIQEAGGWNEFSLTEDTDLTIRLAINGWTTAYLNDCECFEEVPETWPARARQIRRWAMGHNTVMVRQWRALLRSPHLDWKQKLDGVLLLGSYLMSPVLLLGWVATIGLYFLAPNPLGASFLGLLLVMAFGTLGNFAAFFEVAAGVRLDGRRRRARLLPLNLVGFILSIMVVSAATLEQLLGALRQRRADVKWDKTPRFRRAGK